MPYLPLFALLGLAGLVIAKEDRAKPLPVWDNVKGLRKVRFKYDSTVSDEFKGRKLNEKKWDPHGLTNGNTGCPKWNGPVDWVEPIYSTYHATTTETNGKKIGRRKRQYIVKGGQLRVRTSSKPERYFKKREYYCDKKTFRCNHNKKIPCYGTSYAGLPLLKNRNNPKSYAYVIHDKCKIEPFCIPHPTEVVGASRKYRKYVGVNIVGKKLFKYGFFEARVRLPNSPAVTAVWMHDDNMVNGYSRWVKEKDFYRFESPSLIRSRRWQEIDFLEAMNSPVNNLWRQYIPNIHIFAGYKGEFTARRVKKGKLGPVVLDRGVWTLKNPTFSPPDPDRANEFHLNYGNTQTLARPWANKWHTVGMYWSPKEIRFLLDGKETLRLKNTLVHQAMFFTIGTGLNKQWAGQAPSNRQLGKWAKIDYVRRWTVKTRKGKDPPSDLPLRKIMPLHFKSLGNKYKAVDGVFPVKDDGQSLPDPVSRFFGGMLSGLSDFNANPTNGVSPTDKNSTDESTPQTGFLGDPFGAMGAQNEVHNPTNGVGATDENSTDQSKPQTGFLGDPFGAMGAQNEFINSPVQGEEEEEEDELVDPPILPADFWNNSEDENIDLQDLLPAGGFGNELFSLATGRKELLTPEGRREAETREDRLRDADAVPQCDQDAAQTAFEDTNPEVNLAGWATRGGNGQDAGVIPRGLCA